MTFDPAIGAPAKEKTPLPKHRVALGQASRRPLRVRSLLNLAAAIVVSAAVLYAAFAGAWPMAADASIRSQTLHLFGLQQPVKVTLEADGTTHIVAQTDHDLFLATGYMHARFRLFQMDLLRRQGEGRLSEVVGKAALDSDRFELQLGL